MHDRRPLATAAGEGGILGGRERLPAEWDVTHDAVFQAACQALELAQVALFVTDAQACLAFLNMAARQKLAARHLRLSGRKLIAGTELDTRRLHSAIEAAASGRSLEPRAVIVSGGEGEPALQAHVAATGAAVAGAAGQPPLAMVVLGGMPAFVRSEPPIGLTGAEERLLNALVAGERLRAYADRTGVSLATVKTHLQSLFDKTGERRQTDLVRRALSDPRLLDASFSQP